MPYVQDDPAPVRRPKPDLDTSRARARAEESWRRGEAGDLAWLDRAHRLAPADQNLRFQLAFRRLQTGDAARAAPMFEDMALRFGVRECWSGLAACCLALGQAEAARAAIQAALSGFAADPGLIRLAERVAGAAGWCGLDADGVLLTGSAAATPDLLLDGQPATAIALAGGAFRLPASWRAAALLAVRAGDQPLLGSPIDLAAIRRLEGFAERHGDLVSGYAWHPAAPEQDPVLRLLSADGAELARLVATAPRDHVDGEAPLARPRTFRWDAPAGVVVRVAGADGRDLLGSPLPPVPPLALPPARPGLAHVADAGLAVDVIIPVHRGVVETLACIAAVLATIAAPDRLVVVEDAAPEPALVAALARLAEAGRLVLLRTAPGARGFPAAVNMGLRAADGRHAVLLNSDTLVAPGWLNTLHAAACSAADIGTATPLSNEASIFSYPDANGGNPAPDLAATCALAALAAHANAGRLVDVPTAHGFCMFVRADCLAETGLFDEATFAQGYGEENDFSERARALGWRHVAVPAVFVAHLGGVSFGRARQELLRRNLALLEARHPAYRASVVAFLAADPLATARRRLDAARWLAAAAPGAGQTVLLITHGMGGGTARIVAERAEAIRAQGHTPVVLRAADGLCEVGDAAGGFPNLAFALPRELGALARLLLPGRPARAELHHLLGHDHSVMRLLATLAIPYDVWVHDYGWFCARLSFVDGEGRFCGEADTRQCRACLAQWGRGIDDPVSPASLRRRSAADFRHAAAVIVPSRDVARRVMRHVPGLAPRVRAWESDPPFAPPMPVPRRGGLRVAVVGAIGVEKGFGVLLACARDAAARRLDLCFTVIGYTVDDDALLETGQAFITGEFTRGEAARLIGDQGAHMAFLPSVWPETWCYALTDIWHAGLAAAVFDIGTPAERVRAHGRGWVLPLGLPPARLNDTFLRLADAG